jgi:hypothetical protein
MSTVFPKMLADLINVRQIRRLSHSLVEKMQVQRLPRRHGQNLTEDLVTSRRVLVKDVRELEELLAVSTTMRFFLAVLQPLREDLLRE